MANRADVDRVLANVSRATDLAYFFDHLTSPDWIEALQEAELFKSPPSVEAEGDYVRYPAWAASRYLARVAPLAPERVFSVIRQLPHSDNPRVHEDIAQAASAMPVELARKLVSQIRHWVETDRHLLLLPTRVVELAGHLARSGASDDAIELARSLLALSVDEDIIGQRIRTRVSDHDFVDLLQDLAEPLIAAAPDAALRLFIDLLDHALSERYTAPPTSSRRFDDASIIWRPDIGDERDAEARFQPILNSLVDAVVRAARATNDVNDVDPFDLLQGARASVFGRIELQLLAGLSNPCAPNLVSRLLVSRSQLSNQTLELEYLRALRSKADQLTPGQGRRLAKWIRIGPLRAGFLAKRFGDEWPGYLAIWQARRLAALGVAIPVEDTVWASPLVSQIEPSALEPHRPPTVASWIGPSSPRRPEDLAVLSPRELVSFLSEWTPTGEWATPSPEGLGRALTQAIAKHPMRFSKSALEFVGLEPAYVRSVLAGLREGLKQGHRISWSPVVGLATWVVNQPVGQLERDWIHDDRDPGWDWTWTEIGRLLDEGLTDRTNRIPRSMVGQVRFLALRLIDHSDPTPESEAQYGGSNMEPHTLSINTTRGTAAHTLVRLAWWEQQVLGRKRLSIDVQAAIERLATPSEEQSLAVHSVFGMWFGTLTWLDPDWAASLIDRIFPPDPESEAFWWAAWSSFIVFDRPSLAAHGLLRDQYFAAIERLGSPKEPLYFRAGRTHSEALASHIVTYTAWGTEEGPTNGLLTRLFDGPESGRLEYIRQVGRLLTEHGEQVSQSSVEAFRRLWEMRRSVFEKTAGDDMRAEVAQFSWWCGATVLDTGWWVSQLQWVVKNVDHLDASFVVLEALPEAARVKPLAAVLILDAISRMRADPWAIPGHPQVVEEVLTIAVAAGGDAGREAVRLIHDLGAREVADFSRLLP